MTPRTMNSNLATTTWLQAIIRFTIGSDISASQHNVHFTAHKSLHQINSVLQTLGQRTTETFFLLQRRVHRLPGSAASNGSNMAEAEVLLQDLISPFGSFTGSDLQVTAFNLQLWQQSHQIEQRSSDLQLEEISIERIDLHIAFKWE